LGHHDYRIKIGILAKICSGRIIVPFSGMLPDSQPYDLFDHCNVFHMFQAALSFTGYLMYELPHCTPAEEKWQLFRKKYQFDDWLQDE
jgi:hypothetical protein